jgi:signal transduction histidine kinase
MDSDLTEMPAASLSAEETRMLERTAELEAERALLGAVVEQIPVGLIVVDPTGRPTRANAEALRILRLDSMDDPRLSAWRDAEAYDLDGRRLGPDDWPLARTLHTRARLSAERLEVATPGGRLILEISTAPVFAESGEITGALAVFRDVTVPERTERAERDFVTNAAHELQSPLAAIVSAVEVLQAGAKERPDRDMFLGHIERAADRLTRLVRALLVLARAQIGVEAPKNELVALCALLNDVGGELGLDSAVELHVDCPTELAVLTNRELVEQAVVNLAENAAKHTKSGRVVLTARQIEGDVVEIAVSDTGGGIAAANRPRVFERFYRAEANGTAGFGLGLAIVDAVAKALDGELALDSTVGAGTIVRLRLPRAASLVRT